MKRLKSFGIALGLLGVAGIGVQAYRLSRPDSGPVLRTAQISRGDIVDMIAATGTLQAVTTVQVGSQVSGTVSWLGADFNSQVKKGQIIARLDPAIFQAQVDNARANVGNAEAAVQAATTEINNQKANEQAARANQEVTKVQRDDALA